MRTPNAVQQQIIYGDTQADWVRVMVKDAGGTYRDLTTYPGFNAVKSVHWREKIDDPHMTASITLHRESFKLSLSPFVAASALNKAWGSSANQLLALNREIAIQVAIMPADRAPTNTDFWTVFSGRIDTLDVASGPDIQLTARDRGGRLAQQFIKTELVYAYFEDGGAIPLKIWEPQITIPNGTYVLPASRGDDDPGFDKVVFYGTGGLTGTTEPTWTTGSGSDGTTGGWSYVGPPDSGGFDVETIMQRIMEDNLGSGDTLETLSTPVSPGWAIRQFIQSRQFVLEAVRALAGQIGWDLRFLFGTASPSGGGGVVNPTFTFYQPIRSAPSVLHTFQAADYGEPTKLAVDISQIRNKWRVIYSDASALWPDGTPKRKIIEVEDSASITKYGELWAEIIEDDASNIDSSTEATTLANAALSDCKEPTAELSVPLMRGFPWAQLNDFYTFKADGRRSDSDLSLAVTGIDHSFDTNDSGKGKLSTKLECRGLPTAGAAVHLDKTSHPNKEVKQKNAGGSHKLTQFQAPTTGTLNWLDAVGGTKVEIAVGNDGKNALLEEYEIHVSTTNGFTPDDTTLVGLTKGRELTLPNLVPGQEYYGTSVPRWYNAGRLIRGTPSVQKSFVAGRASAGHLHEGQLLGNYPLNNGFETRVDPNGMPDHWRITSGTLGTQVVVMEDDGGLSGGRYLKLAPNATQAQIESALVPFDNEMPEANRYSGLFRVVCWIMNDAANGASNFTNISLYGYDHEGTYVDVLGAISIESNSKVGHWQKVETILRLDAGDSTNREIRALGFDVALGRISGTPVVYLDRIEMIYLGSPWYEIGDTTKFTDNYEAIPGFLNSWVNYDASTQPKAAFRRTQFGRIQLKGLVKNGTVTAAMFTLPPGFRPPRPMRWAVEANGLFGFIEVGAGGDVKLWTGSNAEVDLSVISFEVFQ